MTSKQLKENNAIHDRVAQALADIRITRLEQFIQAYKQGDLTASELLTLTDNLLQDELKQAIGR